MPAVSQKVIFNRTHVAHELQLPCEWVFLKRQVTSQESHVDIVSLKSSIYTSVHAWEGVKQKRSSVCCCSSCFRNLLTWILKSVHAQFWNSTPMQLVWCCGSMAPAKFCECQVRLVGECGYAEKACCCCTRRVPSSLGQQRASDSGAFPWGLHQLHKSCVFVMESCADSLGLCEQKTGFHTQLLMFWPLQGIGVGVPLGVFLSRDTGLLESDGIEHNLVVSELLQCDCH